MGLVALYSSGKGLSDQTSLADTKDNLHTWFWLNCAELRKIIYIEQYLKMFYSRFSSTEAKNRQFRKGILGTLKDRQFITLTRDPSENWTQKVGASLHCFHH